MFVFDKNFHNPRTYSGTISYERELIADLAGFATFTHSKTVHVTRFINRNDKVFGRPFSAGLGPNDQNGIGVWRRWRAPRNEVGRSHNRHDQALSNSYQFQWNYTLSRDMSDDDNERDPFNFRYAQADNLAPEYNYSDAIASPVQRLAAGHPPRFRVQYPGLGAPAQPQSVGNTPQDHIQPDGSIIKRNTLRKDNEFFTWDIRVAPRSGSRIPQCSIEPIFEIFQPDEQQENIHHQEVTNLIFELRRHGPERPRQSSAGAARGSGQVLRNMKLAGLLPVSRVARVFFLVDAREL